MSQKVTNMINQITDPQARRAVQAIYEELADAYNNHTHNADGAQAGPYYTSKPRTDAETVSAGTASTF